MKTTTLPAPAPAWFVIDAAGQRIGKVAVKAASYLRGKHKRSFSPHQLCGDHIIVINAAKVDLPPKKGLRKTFFRHTGFPGNMKVATLDTMMTKKPAYAVENAIKGMLEENRLRRAMLQRLHVFADAVHPYEAQQPTPLSVTRST